MTEMKLLELIGQAEDQYILDARKRPQKKKSHWPAALAAVLAVAVIGAAGAVLLRGISHQNASEGAALIQDHSIQEPESPPATAVQDTAAPSQPAENGGEFDYGAMLLAAAEYPPSVDTEDFEARSKVWMENQVTDETRGAMNAFAYATAAQVLPGENGCFSPLSLYQALAILASGAEGQTRDQLLSLLGQSDVETLAEESGKLYRINYKDNQQDALQIANSLWLDNTDGAGLPVEYHRDWVMSAAANYYADVFAAEFGQEDTSLALGEWIAQHTGGLLRPDPATLGFTDDTVMAIVNTLYYKAQWAEKFSEADTEHGDFTLEDGTTVQTEFMNRREEMGSAVVTDKYTKSSLPLSTGRMIIVLPAEGVSVDELLTEEALWEEFENGSYESAEVVWRVPKFSTDATFQLEDALQNLGVTDAFTQSADFSPISDTALTVSQVQQGTHIAIDEVGVEAAAYTVIGMEGAGFLDEPLPVVEMNLDRPFLYMITADLNVPLFIGVVQNPNG